MGIPSMLLGLAMHSILDSVLWSSLHRLLF
jgi:hypothetical protein